MKNDFKDLLHTHQTLVRSDLNKVINDLIIRSQIHDEDKIYDPVQNDSYEKYFSDLKKIEFGTKSYKEYEEKYFKTAHLHHAQNRHHFYSSKNEQTKPNLIDLLEAVIDISASNHQYGDQTIESTIKTLKNKGVLEISLEEYILNTLKDLKKL